MAIFFSSIFDRCVKKHIKFPTKKNDGKEDDEFSEWEDDFENKEEKSKYWFTRDKMDKILKVHDYLDKLPEIGKVLSFGSILRVAEDLNKKELQSLEIAVLYSKIPETVKSEIIDPYISIKDDEARISLRIKDSSKDLRRNDLIKKIKSDIKTKKKNKTKKVRKEKKNKTKLKIVSKDQNSQKNSNDKKIIKSVGKISGNRELKDICSILDDCNIEEISKYLIKQGKNKEFPDITLRE